MSRYISYTISALLIFLVYSNCKKDTTSFEQETPAISLRSPWGSLPRAEDQRGHPPPQEEIIKSDIQHGKKISH